jgi:hypothetical protein
MASLESAIRPFADLGGVDPIRYQQPGTVGVPLVRVAVGFKGGTKTFASSGSATVGTYLGEAKTETAPTSDALRSKMSSAA